MTALLIGTALWLVGAVCGVCLVLWWQRLIGIPRAGSTAVLPYCPACHQRANTEALREEVLRAAEEGHHADPS